MIANRWVRPTPIYLMVIEVISNHGNNLWKRTRGFLIFRTDPLRAKLPPQRKKRRDLSLICSLSNPFSIPIDKQ